MKAEEKTYEGRIYSEASILSALSRFNWKTAIPITCINRDKIKKEEGYVTKAEIDYDKDTKIVSVEIEETLLGKFYGRTIVPVVFVNRSRRNDKESIIIDDFTFNEFQATTDLCSFPSLNAVVIN